MSRNKGNRAAGWVANYLTRWWPHAEKTPNGRAGADILGTPGVAWEVKTGITWRTEWMDQAERNGDGGVPVLVYLPPGCGEANVDRAYAIVPLSRVMDLLVAAGYAPPREEDLLRQGRGQ